jgi:hypothetical protein
MALVVATRAKQGPNLLSLSRIKYFGACPNGVASRSCCATQGSVGDRVTPTWITHLDLPFDDEECEERSKEEIRHRKARRRPRSVPRDCSRSVAHLCPLGWGVRTCLMSFWMVRFHT